MRPYIGITDFTSSNQVEAMQRVFKAHLPQGSERTLHVGVMMSRKTLRGIPTKWAEAFPLKERIGSIFTSFETYNCLHYADYDHNREVWLDISDALLYAHGVNAIQLDMIWPDAGQVAHGIHTSRKNVEVILQVGARALDVVENSVDRVVERLDEYDGIIHRVLLDKSMGRGLGMDAQALLPFIRRIREAYPKLGISVAGGLGPDTMHLVEPVVAEFPDVSIDAQGRLRPSGDAIDPIDWDMAEKYLVKALELLG